MTKKEEIFHKYLSIAATRINNYLGFPLDSIYANGTRYRDVELAKYQDIPFKLWVNKKHNITVRYSKNGKSTNLDLSREIAYNKLITQTFNKNELLELVSENVYKLIKDDETNLLILIDDCPRGTYQDRRYYEFGFSRNGVQCLLELLYSKTIKSFTTVSTINAVNNLVEDDKTVEILLLGDFNLTKFYSIAGGLIANESKSSQMLVSKLKSTIMSLKEECNKYSKYKNTELDRLTFEYAPLLCEGKTIPLRKVAIYGGETYHDILLNGGEEYNKTFYPNNFERTFSQLGCGTLIDLINNLSEEERAFDVSNRPVESLKSFRFQHTINSQHMASELFKIFTLKPIAQLEDIKTINFMANKKLTVETIPFDINLHDRRKNINKLLQVDNGNECVVEDSCELVRLTQKLTRTSKPDIENFTLDNVELKYSFLNEPVERILYISEIINVTTNLGNVFKIFQIGNIKYAQSIKLIEEGQNEPTIDGGYGSFI